MFFCVTQESTNILQFFFAKKEQHRTAKTVNIKNESDTYLYYTTKQTHGAQPSVPDLRTKRYNQNNQPAALNQHSYIMQYNLKNRD